MRYAIFSDIHGNVEALEEVLGSIAQSNIDEIFCLGDIVGYGPHPNECIEKIKELNIEAVIGNHDFAMRDETTLEHFNTYAKESAVWTKNNLTAENIRYIASLPFTLCLPNILFVHAAPTFPKNWDYIDNIIIALGEFSGFEENICFVGHTHMPMLFSNDGDVDIFEETANLSGDQRYIINVGSVGQPRDHDPRASYGIIDTELLTFSLVRVMYDVEKVVRDIKNAGLPEFLGERLESGI